MDLKSVFIDGDIMYLSFMTAIFVLLIAVVAYALCFGIKVFFIRYFDKTISTDDGGVYQYSFADGESDELTDEERRYLLAMDQLKEHTARAVGATGKPVSLIDPDLYNRPTQASAPGVSDE